MNFSNLKGKKIILGITGSIATYKTPQMVRDLIKSGAEVRVVCTPASAEFVSFMVLENLTLAPVVSNMFDPRLQGRGAWHIEIAHWCDMMLVAPCTASTISKLVSGNCDNALTCVATALPKDKPLVVAPAMDFTMYENPATQRNIRQLIEDNIKIILPDEGQLASGLVGRGRLPDFSVIASSIDNIFSGSDKSVFNELDSNLTTTNNNTIPQKPELKKLENLKILITAGPTHEKIDDIRYISNYSTGKMGYALAEVASNNSADVILIAGPNELTKPNVNKFIPVVTADEMYNAVIENYNNCDIVIMSAAVADFAPQEKISGKLKKENINNELFLKLKKNIDILKTLGENKSNQILVGFALEVSDEIQNARKKLISKKCDMIVVNTAGIEDSGFGGDNNIISIIHRNSEDIKTFPVMSKLKCAEEIFSEIINLFF